ncbi:hypothetical protein [Escherichia coli]|uniref:hypothetical protein n=1 Tax=Escherichia coli TaxID=562 RepID=UPI0027E48933|nr:hypothetical protein [Escherichia coli]
MTIFKENIVDTNLIGPILTALLAAAGFYCKFWFTRYQASRDQAQKVSRAIEDVLEQNGRAVRTEETCPDTERGIFRCYCAASSGNAYP